MNLKLKLSQRSASVAKQSSRRHNGLLCCARKNDGAVFMFAGKFGPNTKNIILVGN